MLTFGRLVSRHSKTYVVPQMLRFNNYSSSPVIPEPKQVNANQIENVPDNLGSKNQHKGSLSRPVPYPNSHSPMVAAAFESLTNQSKDDIITPIIDSKLKKAATVEEVLSLAEGSGISRRHALRVLSVLSDWWTEGKIQLSDFETDKRFINLCKVLTKGVQFSNTRAPKKPALSRRDDLTTILSVTIDEEDAKMIDNLTLAQRVKVMSTLAVTKRRSTVLLRTLSFYITKSAEQLNLKECGDLLYSMSTLNFLDENLLSRIANDVCVNLEKDIKKSAVVGSILTSVGLLRYKNPVLLDAISEWIVQNHVECRPQDIYSLLMTLAVVSYVPSNSEKLFSTLVPQLNPLEAGRSQTWLEIIWSLVLLNLATSEHVASILNSAFLEEFEGDYSVSNKLKLLNIDSAAQYFLHNYDGPRIPPNSQIRDIKISQPKEKVAMADSIVDSLKSLIQSEDYQRTRISTGLGFFIDAECAFDKKFNPIPLDSATNNKEAVRVAILAHEYHDMCLGKVEPTGFNTLYASILEAQGYKVLAVPYTEFRPKDKLIIRVQYLESRLREIVMNS